jgi:hypothetical protein
MAQYVEVRGNVIEFPDGMAAGDIEKAIKANGMAIPPAAAVQAGKELNTIPRQLGLTARYGLEGLANTAQLVTEPIRYATDRLFGVTGKTMPLGALATKAADAIGLPSPQGSNERVVGDAARLMAGTAGLGGLMQPIAAAPGRAAQFVQSNAGLPGHLQISSVPFSSTAQMLSANALQQVASAAGSGLAGGAAREAGGSPLQQGIASLVGGVGAGMGTQVASDLASKAANTVKNLIPGNQQLVQQRLDQRINIALQTQGIDPATISPAMRASLRDQVGRAVNTGNDLNPEAVARLADYTRLGMTPTRARLTLDPYDVTQEANASKLAAATGSREARLPQIAQQNNQRLIGMIDDMGGSRPVDPYGQGNAVTGTILSQDERLQAGVNQLYGQARDTSGRGLPLDGAAFTTRANQALDEALLGGALPESVAGHMNRIARGEVPFTVDYAEQLKTAIGNLQRGSSDGQTRMALSVVRRALDDTPLMPAPQVNPGNLPAVPGTVPPSPSIAGQQSIDAFNAARQAARERFAWQESSPVIQRALDGANADTFIRNNIISRAAGFDDVAAAAQTINANPAARDSVRTAIVQHLKDSAIGKGGTSQTGNFSGRGMEAALKDLGDRKLRLFFSPEEVEQLRAMARTGSFEVFQPRGSAVNNSNSAAGIAAIVANLADRVRPVANKIPLGEMAISGPLDNLAVWAMQRPAANIPQALVVPGQKPSLLNSLMLPAAATGGLLAAPSQ